MDVEARVLPEPGSNLGVFVRCVVVDDEVQPCAIVRLIPTQDTRMGHEFWRVFLAEPGFVKR